MVDLGDEPEASEVALILVDLAIHTDQLLVVLEHKLRPLTFKDLRWVVVVNLLRLRIQEGHPPRVVRRAPSLNRFDRPVLGEDYRLFCELTDTMLLKLGRYFVVREGARDGRDVGPILLVDFQSERLE